MSLFASLESIFKNNISFHVWYTKHKYKTINFKEFINKKIDFPSSAKNIYKTVANRNIIKSAAIYSCFSKNSLISSSQLYYLRELSKCVDAIILIYDNPIIESELSKLNTVPNIIYMRFVRHGLYDFGSYKIGLSFFKKNNILKRLEYLILCNDSCYGPLFDLNKIICNMNMKDNDFWGMILNNDFIEHLQSWFICLKQNVINSKLFYRFFKKVKHQKYIWDVILKYEVPFTLFMSKAGFKYDSYVPKNPVLEEFKNAKAIYGNLTFYPMGLINGYNFPFIKKKCFSDYAQINNEIYELINYLKQNNAELYSYIIKELK